MMFLSNSYYSENMIIHRNEFINLFLININSLNKQIRLIQLLDHTGLIKTFVVKDEIDLQIKGGSSLISYIFLQYTCV